MGADISRDRFNALKNYAGVQFEQGKVLLDSDLNESSDIQARMLRAAVSDIFGGSTVSAATPDAFKIELVAGRLMINPGRAWVNGLLAENHGRVSTNPDKKLFDPRMAETRFADAIPYDEQPFLPGVPPLTSLPPTGLIYLVVWNREVTHLEQPDLVEVAVGVETSARRQTVWQVRVFEPGAGRPTCATPDDEIAGWAAHIAPSSARLTTGTLAVAPAADPCELPPTGGYRGLENHTYRVEIHDPGQPGGEATFKWSRDVIGSRVTEMISETELALESLGRDDVLRFNPGDWIEIIDDVRELSSQRCGDIRRITAIDEAARRITFTPALDPDLMPVSPGKNMRVRCWHHSGKVLGVAADGSTSVFCDLDAGNRGVIPVPDAGTRVLLEGGITVSFDPAGPEGFHAGDRWAIAARTADASVELLDHEPPLGTHRHFYRLAMCDGASGSLTDCRTHWPPVAESESEHGCGCTVCVSPALHASGALTIQTAVDRVRETGGTVCLGAGRYVLNTPVQVAGTGVSIKGQGAATVILAPAGGAFAIANAVAPVIEDLTILSLGQRASITARTVVGLILQRLVMLVVGVKGTPAPAIALSGAVVGASIRDNAIMAPVGIQGAQEGEGQRLPLLLTAALRIEDNVLWCARSAIVFGSRSLHLLSTRLSGNEVIDCHDVAIAALGLSEAGGSCQITGNTLSVYGPGINVALAGVSIEGNTLTAMPDAAARRAPGAGIALSAGLDPGGSDRCQIRCNQIRGFSGAGISLDAGTRSLIVADNLIEQCGLGILCDGQADASTVSIDGNQLREIGTAAVEGTKLVVGLRISRAETASVTGNTIRRIGPREGRGAPGVGILAAGVQLLKASGNDVAEIAPEKFDGSLSAGMVVLAPIVDVDVAGNHIRRDAPGSAPESESQWLALMLDTPFKERPVLRVGDHAAVRLDDVRMAVFAGTRPYLVTAPAITPVGGAPVARGANATIRGNVLVARGAAPAVAAAMHGDCLFGDNRCELGPPTRVAAVRLTARTIIASANRVQGGDPSIELNAGANQLTVLGNITTARIATAGGASLGPPWEPLNVKQP